MSYIRLTQAREWTDGDSMYVYPNGQHIYAQVPGWGVPAADWVEVTMRMLDQSGEFDGDELDRIFNALSDRTYLDDPPDVVSGLGPEVDED